MPTDDCRPSTIEYDDDFDDDGDAEPRFGKPDLASAVTARPARHSPILSRPEAISSPGTAARRRLATPSGRVLGTRSSTSLGETLAI